MIQVPIKLTPVAKDYLWGGSRLNDDFNLRLKGSPLAEAWVCSTHPDGESTAPVFNCTLMELISAHPEMLGSHVLAITGGKAELPILIKLIDAKSDLSVQVHPDDEYSKRVENDRGKTEFWYVLDAKKGAQLIYGFNRDVGVDEVRGAVADGSIVQLLNHVPVQKNDLFFVTPGTVHAIGAGCLIAEIQESSNITYRFYDYDRVGKDGKKRPLHIDRALEVADLRSSTIPRQPIRTLNYRAGCATELLSRCQYFMVQRMLLNTEVHRSLVDYQTGENSFHALLVVDGCGSISWDDGAMNIFKGDCVFIPAESIPLKLHGRAQLLDVSC